MSDATHELGQYIPVHYHYHMLQDEARMQAFAEAIIRVVPPGGRVLDLGGGTGVMSYFAAHIATQVWCVEHNAALVREARRILELNPHSERIEIVEADAMQYLPPEPVDVVICEMLHVGMLREKQLPVIDDFKRRYAARFGSLPVFLPEAFIQAIQPIQHDFDYMGFYAPGYVFQDPLSAQPRSIPLGEPQVYQLHSYRDPYPLQCGFNGALAITQSGEFNALRIITKNVLAVVEAENRTVDWFNQYLIVPLTSPIQVATNTCVHIEFDYPAGGALESFAPHIHPQYREASCAAKNPCYARAAYPL
ncbi:MAG: methyltransferase domain-containing protein [Pseudomonadota bacterium]